MVKFSYGVFQSTRNTVGNQRRHPGKLQTGQVQKGTPASAHSLCPMSSWPQHRGPATPLLISETEGSPVSLSSFQSPYPRVFMTLSPRHV